MKKILQYVQNNSALRSHQSHNYYAILTMRLAQFKVQCGRIFCKFGICLLICTHKVCLKTKYAVMVLNVCALRTAHLTLYFKLNSYGKN